MRRAKSLEFSARIFFPLILAFVASVGGGCSATVVDQASLSPDSSVYLPNLPRVPAKVGYFLARTLDGSVIVFAYDGSIEGHMASPLKKAANAMFPRVFEKAYELPLFPHPSSLESDLDYVIVVENAYGELTAGGGFVHPMYLALNFGVYTKFGAKFGLVHLRVDKKVAMYSLNPADNDLNAKRVAQELPWDGLNKFLSSFPHERFSSIVEASRGLFAKQDASYRKNPSLWALAERQFNDRIAIDFANMKNSSKARASGSLTFEVTPEGTALVAEAAAVKEALAREAEEERARETPAGKAKRAREIAALRAKSAALDPDSRARAEALFRQAFELFQAGEFDAAVAGFKKGMEIDLANGLAHFYLAETYARQDKTALARTHYRLATEFAPESKEGLIAKTRLKR